MDPSKDLKIASIAVYKAIIMTISYTHSKITLMDSPKSSQMTTIPVHTVKPMTISYTHSEIFEFWLFEKIFFDYL